MFLLFQDELIEQGIASEESLRGKFFQAALIILSIIFVFMVMTAIQAIFVIPFLLRRCERLKKEKSLEREGKLRKK